DKVGNADEAGSVQVVYGSVNGLTGIGRKSWTKDTAGIRGVAQAGDRIGAVVVAGDFNRDGFDDLAIGAPGATVNGKANAGAVHILYGSSKGLRAAGNQVWMENSSRIGGTPQ